MGGWNSDRGNATMANMFQMMKQAATMQREMKRIQKELARQTVTFENAGVKVTAHGDMTVAEIEISQDLMARTPADKLGRQLVLAVNGALTAAKKQAAAEMQKLTAGTGLGDMLGGG